MATTLSSINIDTNVKREAMRNAKAMGLQFSTLVNGLLRTFNEEKSVTFAVPEIPNPETSKILRKHMRNRAAGKSEGVAFTSAAEMDAFLDTL